MADQAPAGRFDEIGTTGLKQWNGVIYEEFLRQLQGFRAVEVYREMSSNDSIVVAILRAVEMLIRRLDWYVEPGDGPNAEADAEFLESCLADLNVPWSAFVGEALTFLPFGWSLFETVYKRRMGDGGQTASKFDDGRIGWRKFAIRAQETLLRWEFDDSGGIAGMWQLAPGDIASTLIPIDRAVLFRTAIRKGSPEGVSILRGAYRDWFFKKRIEESEAIGIDRDLAGLPKMRIPLEWFIEDRYSAQFAYAKKMVESVRVDEQAGVLLPAVYDEQGNLLVDFDLISASNSSSSKQFDTDQVINRKNQGIATSCLFDVLLLGHDRVGSNALASTKEDITTMALEAWPDEIADVLNTHAVPRLLRLNGLDVTSPPRICHSPLEKVDIAGLADAVQKLSAAGMPLFPSDSLEAFIREQAGWPAKDPAETQMAPMPAMAPLAPSNGNGAAAPVA